MPTAALARWGLMPPKLQQLWSERYCDFAVAKGCIVPSNLLEDHKDAVTSRPSRDLSAGTRLTSEHDVEEEWDMLGCSDLSGTTSHVVPTIQSPVDWLNAPSVALTCRSFGEGLESIWNVLVPTYLVRRFQQCLPHLRGTYWCSAGVHALRLIDRDGDCEDHL